MTSELSHDCNEAPYSYDVPRELLVYTFETILNKIYFQRTIYFLNSCVARLERYRVVLLMTNYFNDAWLPILNLKD